MDDVTPEDEKEHHYLDVLIHEFVNLPSMKYLYCKHQREERRQTILGYMEFERDIQERYGKQIEMPRSRIIDRKKKTLPQEIKWKELTEEVQFCQDDPHLQ